MFNEMRDFLENSLHLYETALDGSLDEKIVDNGFNISDVTNDAEMTKLEYGLLSGITNKISDLKVNPEELNGKYSLNLIRQISPDSYEIGCLKALKMPAYVEWQKWRYEGISSGKFQESNFSTFDTFGLSNATDKQAVLQSNLEFPSGESTLVQVLDENEELKEIEVIPVYASLQDNSSNFRYHTTVILPNEEIKNKPFLLPGLKKEEFDS